MARSDGNAQGSAAPAHERAASLDWGHLRYFLELTRTGSLSRAAQRLAVDRNTVARRIGALEEELGLALFERGPQGWTCTDAGKDLAELVSHVEDDVLAIARHADAHDTTLAGNVRLTTASHLSAHLLVPALPALRARHPRVLLEIAADQRAFDLIRREADLALRMGRPNDPGLVTRKLSDVAYRFYAGKGTAAAKRGKVDLSRDPLVTFEESLARTPQERWLAKAAPDRTIVFRCNSTASLHSAARAGVGVAMLPCFVADTDPALVRLQGAEPPNHELWLLVHGDLRRAPRVRAVIEWVDDLVAAARPLLTCAEK